MAELERDDSKRVHALLLPNWHSAWGKAKAGPGAQLQLWLQVSIWDIGQGQSWEVTGYHLKHGSRPKLGHSYSFSQVSIRDMEQGQSWGTVQFQSG